MPELAEVLFYSKEWAPAVGRLVKRVELHSRARVFRGCDPTQLEEGLLGKKLLKCLTHGKQMLFEFSEAWLGIHLGMTGELKLASSPYDAKKHDHLVLHMSGSSVLVFADPRQFGAVRFSVGPAAPPWWRELPPQPIDSGFTLSYLTELVQRSPKQPLKALLLDQSRFPGIGNWMADEILWQLKLNPQTLPADLSPKAIRSLHAMTKKVCEVALATIGVDWSDPPAKWLFHQRWSSNNPCPRCGTKLAKEQLRGRTACWCPKCQRLPKR